MHKRAIDLHVIDEKLEFNDVRERTGGQRSEGILTLGPGNEGPMAHIHTHQVEGFEVLSGSLVLVVGGTSVTLRAGESFVVPAGQVHKPRNDDTTTSVVAKFWYEPALNTEWMLQSMGEWAMERGGDWRKVPLVPTACLMFRLRGEYRLAGMPFWLQDVLFGILTVVAHITGQATRVGRPVRVYPVAG